MANLTGMPISSLPETTLQEGDQVVGYRAETGKAYRTDLADQIADLTEQVNQLNQSLTELNNSLGNCSFQRKTCNGGSSVSFTATNAILFVGYGASTSCSIFIGVSDYIAQVYSSSSTISAQAESGTYTISSSAGSGSSMWVIAIMYNSR